MCYFIELFLEIYRIANPNDLKLIMFKTNTLGAYTCINTVKISKHIEIDVIK